MPKDDDALAALRGGLAAFVAERDWSQFHHPRDLAMAVAIESGELLENFLWSGDVAPEKRVSVEREAADVYLYLLLLADRVGFDLVAAAQAKLEENARKYPVEKARGRAAKYTDL